MTLPSGSLTIAPARTSARPLRRATSPMSAGTWPCWSSICANWLGFMPYCWEALMMYSMSSGWDTSMPSAFTTASSTNWVRRLRVVSSVTSARCSSSSRRFSPSR